MCWTLLLALCSEAHGRFQHVTSHLHILLLSPLLTVM